MAAAGSRRVSVFPSVQELGPALAQLVVEAAAAAAERGDERPFSLGLSGGSLVGLLAQHLPPAVASSGPAAPARWLVAFCDERLVPLQDPESTAGAYQAQLFPRLPGPPPRVLLPSTTLPPEAAAQDYAAQLAQAFPGEHPPVFDLLLLGVGPDGHTGSLFPGHPLLQERALTVGAVRDSPKPPPCRITLTLPVLGAARSVAFVATGAAKAPVIKRILEEQAQDPLPAARVLPRSGQLHWLLDQAAAQGLQGPLERLSEL